MSTNIEMEIRKYSKIKLDLLKISKCIECCELDNEKETYQNIAIEYSKELKRIYSSLEDIYDVKICGCCKIED